MKKQRTSEEMEQVMREYTQSGESVREFCLRIGLAEHLLRYWMKRLEKRDVGFSADETKGFSELKISKGAAGFLSLPPYSDQQPR